MPLISATSLPELPARDGGAPCHACGRRGTVGLVQRGAPATEVERFCRRCWPRAHRDAWRAYVAESVRGSRAWLRWAEGQARGGRREPEPPEAAVPGFRAAWHWTVALGSLWRDHRESARWHRAVRPPAAI